MGSIVVTRIPNCGEITVTHSDGSTEAIVQGMEFDLTLDPSFGWEGGSECIGEDNTWAYYYNRAAVGNS